MKHPGRLFVAFFLLSAIPCFAASDYLRVGGVKGESTDAKHPDWIELSSFSWGMASSRTAAAPAHFAQGCAANEFRFTARAGSAAAQFQNWAATGTPKQITLDAAGQQHDLENAIVTSFSLTPANTAPMMNCVIKFQRCRTHSQPAATVNASVLGLNTAPTRNSQLLFGNNPAEDLVLVGVTPSGANNVVLKVKAASPKLALFCANGKHFPTVKLTCRKAGKGQQEFLKITMSDVLISSYQVNGDGSASIGLKFASADNTFAGFQDIH